MLLVLWGALRKKKILPSKEDLLVLAASGLLFWIGGNGLVILAEQRLDSGLAALVVATMPIWVALYESVLDRKLPSPILTVSLITGFGGIVILSYPVLTSGIRADVLSILALLLASLSWSCGLVLQARKPVSVSRGVSSGYQQLFGGLFYTLIALLLREPLPAPTQEAWLAWGYLVLFGSIIAFTSFVNALQLLPASLVTTYAYVNPVIAVFLGWLILREPISGWMVAGGLFVLLGVSGIFWVNNQKKSEGRDNPERSSP
jgi:drug/metabolite transporter (DMT)-like permease